ncbi:MAG: pyridoxal phosphate-dependent aminotransferase [Terriglobales bacterium]
MFSRRTNWDLAPNRFTRAVEQHRRAGREVLDLTASNPTAVGFEYDPSLLHVLANPAALGYSPDAKGMCSACEAVSEYYATRGEHVPQENIILTTSTSEAYSFVFRLLCDPEDEVQIPAPGYPLFDFLGTLQDVRLKPYGLFYDHGWHLDAHSVRTAVTDRTRAVMAVHPNNPTGSYVHPGDAAQLNAIAAERELGLVIDEVFLDFAHDGQPRPSFAVNDAALTFTLSGLSKIAGLPQMKFAWIVVSGPESLVATALERLEVIADTYLSMNAPIQLAAPAMFAARESFQRQLMARVRANLAELDAQLARQSLCSRLEVEAGWYATLRVPVGRTDEELAIELLEQLDVLVHPGHFYEFSGDGYLVLSLIAPEAEFREGVLRLLKSF